MEQRNFPCANCKLRAKFDANPKSFLGRLWRFHIKFCPGWKAYFNSLGDTEKQGYIEKYGLKNPTTCKK